MRVILILLSLLAVSACARGLSEGPDEFGVVPSEPLQTPPSLTSLPPPMPGGVNRADANPQADLARALGGQAQGFGISEADEILIVAASRFGVEDDIRDVLFAQDARLRERRGRLRIFGGGEYLSLYANQALDAQAEGARFRALGVRVPSPSAAQ